MLTASVSKRCHQREGRQKTSIGSLKEEPGYVKPEKKEICKKASENLRDLREKKNIAVPIAIGNRMAAIKNKNAMLTDSVSKSRHEVPDPSVRAKNLSNCKNTKGKHLILPITGKNLNFVPWLS